MRPLYKTTIVIWTEDDPATEGFELDTLASEATDGDAYCSKMVTDFVEDPAEDETWDGTEFFGAEELEESDDFNEFDE